MKKKIVRGCLLGCLGIILIPIVFMTLLMHSGWRANVYEYSGAVEGFSRWHEGVYLLWHNGESFEMVYSFIEHPRDALGEERGWVADFNKERIGRIRNLPVINSYRPDVNRLGRAYIYEIEGLNSGEWMYVLYEERHNWVTFNWHHRIYRSTNLEIEDPIEFLRNYIDGIGLNE